MGRKTYLIQVQSPPDPQSEARVPKPQRVPLRMDSTGLRIEHNNVPSKLRFQHASSTRLTSVICPVDGETLEVSAETWSEWVHMERTAAHATDTYCEQRSRKPDSISKRYRHELSQLATAPTFFALFYAYMVDANHLAPAEYYLRQRRKV